MQSSYINLMDKRRYYYLFSFFLLLPGVLALLFWGLNLGLDFTGGSLLEIDFEKEVDSHVLQEELVSLGYVDNVVQMTPSGHAILRLRELNTYTGIVEPPLSLSLSESVSDEIASGNIEDTRTQEEVVDPDEDEKVLLLADLESRFGPLEEIEYQSIGPSIGQELLKNALMSVFLASFFIVIYVIMAFWQVPEPASSWRFGVCAIAALLHDILFLLGVFAILGELWNIEISGMFVVAALTVMGFSVHDTIVVFDRIRENLIKHPTDLFEHVANNSVLETLARSLNTSLTVLFTLLALLLFGGSSVATFVLALLIGILVGAYSSIFFASPLLVDWQRWVEKKS